MHDVHRIPVLEPFLGNMRFGARMARKSPMFAAAMVLTLTLGIGANTAVFSAIDAVILRPLPFPESDRLVLLRQYNHNKKSPSTFVAPIRIEDWNRMSSTFQSVTGYYTEDVSETSGPLPEKVTRAFVAPRFLQVWGVSPKIGRDFIREEERFGGPFAVLISDRLWRRRFNADPDVLGKKLRFGEFASVIIGVMPASFLFQEREVDLWLPIPSDAPYAQSRESAWYTAVGRLKPGITLDGARADLTVVQQRLGAQFPLPDADLDIQIEPLKENMISGSKNSLWILFGGVTLLLLIACSNVAGLLLSRATLREHEIAVRFAVGASRRTVISQLLTEVFLLTLLGSIAGLILSLAAPKLFAVMANNLPRVDEMRINWRVGVYSLLCAGATAFLAGIIPALRSTRESVGASLSRGSRTYVSRRNPFQWILAGMQVALAVTLLVAAGLLLRSFQQLGQVDPGFDRDHVLRLHVSATWGETTDMKSLTQRIDRTLEALRAVPSVEAVATAGTLPGVPRQYPTELNVTEGDVDPSRKIIVDARFVSAGYFSTLEIPFLEGEACRADAARSDVIVNRSFATTFFPQRSIIGHHLQTSAYGGVPIIGEVRGMVADAREQGINTAPMPTVYFCLSAPVPDPNYLVRTRGNPLLLAASLRRAIHDVEPGRSIFDVNSLSAVLGDSFAENRMRATLFSFFALTALSLACIGLYATLSYLTSAHSREIGLRLALGAQRSQILSQFLSRGLGVAIAGCAVGLALSATASKAISGMLYGVAPYDPVTISLVLGLVFVVATSACIVPSLRASRIDPLRTLHENA